MIKSDQKFDTMKALIHRYWISAIFTVAGAGLGFAYWRFIGCTSGTCPLTANWHTSTLFGGLIGMTIVPSRWKAAKHPVPSESETTENQ